MLKLFPLPLLPIGFLFIIFMAASCGAKSRKDTFVVSDSVLIVLPQPDSITPKEKMRLGHACQRWFDSVLGHANFNGAVLVAKGGNIVFEKYTGAGQLQKGEPISDSTAFHIASVSKTVTAMAVLRLEQEGKLNIDSAFSSYFPDFNYPGVTVKTLLNHRSGLPNYLHFTEQLKWNNKVYMRNQDVYNLLVTNKSKLKNITPPGKRFSYCNTNYALLALLIEKISGQSFPEYINETFFYPLNMRHSFVFTLADSATVNPSFDWRGQRIPFDEFDLVYGDKNVYSTARDLLIWDRALRTNALFTPATLSKAYTPYSNEKRGTRNYGLGWRMNLYPNGKKLIYHNGWWHGFNASFLRMIDEKATIIVLGNRFTHAVYKSKYLAAIFDPGFDNVEAE